MSSGPGAATFAVRAKSFVVTISAVNGPTWVDAELSGSSSPLFEGILDAGGSKPFIVHGSLAVEVGSSAARVAVEVGSKQVASYVPPAAPFSMRFQSVA